MLRLIDARTDAPAEVRPARPGLLRICAHAPGPGAGAADLTGLRVLLVADLLARAAELGNLQAITVLAFGAADAAAAADGTDGAATAAPPAERTGFEQAAEALGTHPPVARASAADARAAIGGPIDVHLISDPGQLGRDAADGLAVPVGAARLTAPDANGADAAAADPSAVRFALLSVPYDQPADLTEPVLAEAARTVRRWRRQVADWAESPSKPMPPDRVAAIQATFGDLDTVRLLAVVGDLAADTGVPVGAKFETSLYADRLLSLDLPADIGKPRD